MSKNTLILMHSHASIRTRSSTHRHRRSVVLTHTYASTYASSYACALGRTTTVNYTRHTFTHSSIRFSHDLSIDSARSIVLSFFPFSLLSAA